MIPILLILPECISFIIFHGVIVIASLVVYTIFNLIKYHMRTRILTFDISKTKAERIRVIKRRIIINKIFGFIIFIFAIYMIWILVVLTFNVAYIVTMGYNTGIAVYISLLIMAIVMSLLIILSIKLIKMFNYYAYKTLHEVMNVKDDKSTMEYFENMSMYYNCYETLEFMNQRNTVFIVYLINIIITFNYSIDSYNEFATYAYSSFGTFFLLTEAVTRLPKSAKKWISNKTKFLFISDEDKQYMKEISEQIEEMLDRVNNRYIETGDNICKNELQKLTDYITF